MDDLRSTSFQKYFSQIRTIWAGDKEGLSEMEPRLRLKRYPSEAGLEPGIASSVGQRLTH